MASAETRTLKLYFVHTKERAEITFKRNGRYDQAGLQKINQFLRDWRRNEPTKMDPRLLDLLWAVYRSVGATDYVHVVSAYRSPATNSMLRSRSKGVAKSSQHMLGKAMDFYIPGVSLKQLRAAGMKMEVGGVGYYPNSGSPFVHMDVGNVRHWPRMSRRELVALFPDGKTLHVPTDGKPLPGFEQALASYEARKKNGGTALALASAGAKKPSKGLLAALFGNGEDEDEEGFVAPQPQVVQQAPARAAPQTGAVVAKAEPKADARLPGIQVVPPEQAQRVDLPAAEEAAAPETIIAALPAREVPLPMMAPRPQADVGFEQQPNAGATQVASNEPTPDNIPFGMAQEPPADMAAADPNGAANQPLQVAAGVPLPTPRPDLIRAAQDVDPGPQDEVLLALAAAERDPLTASDAQAVPMPAPRPEHDDVLQSMISPAPRPEVPAVQNEDDRVALAAAVKASEERVAALASISAASPKRAIADGLDPQAVAALGVRTTPKLARPTAQDAKPDRKTRVKAAEPQAARWVINKDYVLNASQNTTAPSFAYNVVVTAPREVYTAGFMKGDEGVANANRFSGKAVTFMPVTRFE
ncbi:DUF882 domain-containing protein [Pseudaminobacter sp. 19-2017]|uniref:Murein endopeptidase K n=1 Tax=Pseudaminobacter soli (ex Zhang et al. 2022) TaxID=2831468 RepID=A0A942IAF0_9HYPH|nr:DUF882 domain-containing protein [Pseudaminobacter soli]MBS3650391.1 DUF882 domain-containing protein [Pseudaminobacter soli]